MSNTKANNLLIEDTTVITKVTQKFEGLEIPNLEEVVRNLHKEIKEAEERSYELFSLKEKANKHLKELKDKWATLSNYCDIEYGTRTVAAVAKGEGPYVKGHNIIKC